MNPLLEAYLAIFKTFPSKQTFSKAQKKARYHQIISWEKDRRLPLPTLDELSHFIKAYHDEISLSYPFLKNVSPYGKKRLTLALSLQSFWLIMN